MHGAHNTYPNALILSTKIHMHSYKRAYATVQKLLAMENIANLSWVLREL